MNGVHAATFRAVEALERAGLSYALMGGVATQALAIPTATFDVDMTIQEESVSGALAALASAGFEIPEEHRKGFRDTLEGMGKVRVIWPEPERPVEVDIFIVTTPFQRASFERRQRAALTGRSVWVFTPEDIVLYKLLAWRPKDRGSVQDLLIANPQVDLDYLRAWAGRLRVAERLEEALKERDRFWNE